VIVYRFGDANIASFICMPNIFFKKWKGAL